jgi:hypothetical protein
MSFAHHFEEPTTIQTNLGAIFISMELSRSTWLITSLSPGSGEKISKHGVSAGDIAALFERFLELKQKALARTSESFPIIVIQEAGLDGFWIHRVLRSEDIESYVVDPASIATSRRRRRAKTDKIDGEALVRALLAYKRGEPRVCAMVRAPTPEDEDSRRLCRERKVLIIERVQHVNRIKGFCSPRAFPTTSRCVAIDANGLASWRPAMVVRCRRIFGLRSAVNSTGLSYCSNRSRPSKRSGMPCSLRRRHKTQKNRHKRC